MSLSKFSNVKISAFYALLTYVLANGYLTLVVNWFPEKVELIGMAKMNMVAQLNYTFCLYALFVILMMLLEQFLGAFIVHVSIIVGYFIGISLIYAVLVACSPIVSVYITFALIINAILSLYSIAMFYMTISMGYLSERSRKRKFENSQQGDTK